MGSRLLALVAVAGATLAGLVTAGGAANAADAAADDAADVIVPVSGPFEASGTLGGPPCVGPVAERLRQVVDGAGDWTGLGESTFHLEYCIVIGDQDPPDWPVEEGGTFEIAARGGTLSGDVTGTVHAASAPFTFRLVLTVTGGTGRYRHASGELVLVGEFTAGGISATGDVSGAIRRHHRP